jgi:ribosomal protein S18 acetylase RimI-like enzyme
VAPISCIVVERADDTTNTTQDNVMTNQTQNQPQEAQQAIPDKNLFMMCQRLNTQALRSLSQDYHIRTCRQDELDIWKAMPFDTPEEAETYRGYMTSYFSRVYAKQGSLFYQRCLFVCDATDRPIATAFVWRAYDVLTTIHWLKVVKEHEGKGIGRALLSMLMSGLRPDAYPVYLHTQPGSYRAIKLYTDFGFAFVSDPIIGNRKNDLEACLPMLEQYMTPSDFKKLKHTEAPEQFLRVFEGQQDDEF